MPRNRSCLLGVWFDAGHGLCYLGIGAKVQGLVLTPRNRVSSTGIGSDACGIICP